ncbi:cholesterol 7-desaturase nvd [Leptidea sinapis]|uniref:cholesterol 7-desaturase nvd n=1 Tax=Leptidea sinapis TaxID=189913 RepID=UPI0021C47A3D|nr:cholesterol 7-desaturase nvd [Leptidea sinapis]
MSLIILLFFQNLTEIGFEHVPYLKGVDGAMHLTLAQKNRQLGYKIPSPYPNGWYAIAESYELKIGTVQTATALGLNFCVYRGEDGVARAVDAYCPHLGANLGIGGEVKGNCIECPFHQWRFDTEGKCIHIPDVENIPKGVSIKTWETMEVDGAVWIWYDAEGRPPMWKSPPHDDSKDYGYRGRNEFIISAHIRFIVFQIGPAQVRLFFNSKLGPMVVYQSITPIGPMLLKVVHRVYSPSYIALFGVVMVYGEAYQFERDVVVWNNKTHVSSPPFVKPDKAVKAFRDWYSQFYSPNSKSMKDALQNPLEW